MKLKFLIILICIYSSLFSQNTNCTPQVEPMPSPALHLPRLVWQNQTATTLNVQKSQNNVNDWTSGATVNRPIADGESITFRSNNGIKAVGLGRGLRPEASLIWRQPHSISYGFYINRWSGTAYPMESQGSAGTRIDYENEGRPWNDNSVFKIKRVCNKVYYYMDDIQFPHVSTIINPGDLFYFDMNFKDALGWVYDVTIYGACGIQDCTNGSITPTFTQIDPICAGGTFTLPTASNNTIPVTGSWSPAINNQATTTYTFTPDAGQSASTATMTVTVNNPTVPTFTPLPPICRGGTFTLPTISNNEITGSWSPAVNNQATTEYTFTPASGQCASNTTMTVIVNNATVPIFTQVPPICAGGSFSLPTTSDNGIAGTWLPVVNNQATTEYTFTPNQGQCASTTTMTVTVNPSVNLVLSSGSNNQTVDKDVAISSVTYIFGNGASGVTVTGLPTGVSYATQGNDVTISGTPTVAGTFNYTVSTIGGCGNASLQGTFTVVTRDWKLAPNSYIFTGKEYNPSTKKYDGADVDGLYIPVKKAYILWREGLNQYAGRGTFIPQEPIIGDVTAEVLWEDTPGLIKCGSDYKLEGLIGENGKITVPINKALEGNAVIAIRDSNGTIRWSWHVWVTDDPTNGSTYNNNATIKKQVIKSDGTKSSETITGWQWMDRNLGALGSSITGADQYDRNGGLLYQWGRKDPFPLFVDRGGSFYKVSGTVGNFINNQTTVNLTSWGLNGFNATVNSTPSAEGYANIKYSINNPFKFIINNQVYPNSSVKMNWFGSLNWQVPANYTREAEVNLWSDNMEGRNFTNPIPNNDYKSKAVFDPCPNEWRIPSMTTTMVGYTGMKSNFSPFGFNNDTEDFASFTGLGMYKTMKPANTSYPNNLSFARNIKVYPNLGVDLTAFGATATDNLGQFPGTGRIYFHSTKQSWVWQDQHHTLLWTATMSKQVASNVFSTNARALLIIPENEGTDIPDSSLPNITGRYHINPMEVVSTTEGAGCRCVRDPLFIDNKYNFPTEYYSENVSYTEGINEPNTEQREKGTGTIIEIAVSKAIAMQNHYLNNKDIIKPASYNNLIANVYWATDPNLIRKIEITNPSPSNLASIKDSKIKVFIGDGKSGNAIITLHNGSITNPVYWSWHIWITDTAIGTKQYVTTQGDSNAPNYVNYVQNRPYAVKATEFLDRDLGAMNELPTSATDLGLIKSAAGLHYQWGRKDPLPVFKNSVDESEKLVYLGTPKTDGSGEFTYTELSRSTYESTGGTYLKKYNDYSVLAGVILTDKTALNTARVLNYSVKNPLVFMMPSDIIPYTGIGKFVGNDWLSKEPNVFYDRWGKGNAKSPFDPCPKNYRIPDILNIENVDALTTSGGSPWYKNNVLPGKVLSISTNYPLTPILNSDNTKVLGYVGSSTSYNVGNYANSGIRGQRDAFNVSDPIKSVVTFTTTKWWTASLQLAYQSRPNSLSIDFANKTLTATDTNADPYFAAPCRCVREKGFYDEKIPVQADAMSKSGNVFREKEIRQKIEQKKLTVFPNPVKDILYIDAKDNREYYYQMYNMSGQLVKEGKFDNKQTNISSLTTGVYLIRINNSETVVKIIKQ